MTMRTLTTTNEIIDALGGNGPVALITSTTAKAVSNWRGQETFPSNTYLVLQDALSLQNLTAPDELWAMRTTAFARWVPLTRAKGRRQGDPVMRSALTARPSRKRK
jgi:hypothetical protein